MSYSRSKFELWGRYLRPRWVIDSGRRRRIGALEGRTSNPSSSVALPRRARLSGYGSGLARGPEVGPLGEAVLRCHRDKVLGVTSGGYGRLGASSGLPRPGAALSGTAVREWTLDEFRFGKRLSRKRGLGQTSRVSEAPRQAGTAPRPWVGSGFDRDPGGGSVRGSWFEVPSGND
ncbi:hypothetical protein G5714_024685 [Onychostoma macrolepis]|uniref:Uncharacterized protein n=1 Tax=Onychostoma macrolepis TaxID=369639 RepID=A0A7J6BK52_9TELE|nr:hypothetical protein G5714_024685 [Onychostoma macrolepis]